MNRSNWQTSRRNPLDGYISTCTGTSPLDQIVWITEMLFSCMCQYFQDVFICFNDAEFNSKSIKFGNVYFLILGRAFKLCDRTACKMLWSQKPVSVHCGGKITVGFTRVCFLIKYIAAVESLENSCSVKLSFGLTCKIREKFRRGFFTPYSL